MLRRIVIAAVAVCALGTVHIQAQKNEFFRPKEVWNDTEGNPINAHGGGILYHKGTYYWYGEYKVGKTVLPSDATWERYRTDVTGVSCYSSKDLLNWKFEGVALKAITDDPNSDIITTHFEYHCMEDNLLKLDMLGHDDPTMIKMLEDLTGVNARAIPLDDPDTMSIFTSSKVLGFENDEILGPTGAVAIPEFNTRFTRGMLMDTMPKDFNTLVRLSGFSHGTDVWLGNARELIVSGTASVLETVGCRDDIMLYLISMGLDPKMSFKIMEAVRKGKVKKGGFQEGWEEAMRDHKVPDWYIGSLAKIGYLFPKAHAVAYVMMAFRIAWFKVHEPLAFYATFFSIRAKAFDAEYCCAGLDAVKQKIKEIENNKDATDVEQNLMVTLEVCYEFYLRGFHFDTIDIYKSDATRFKITENGLLPPFVTVRGLGETAALDTVEKRKGKTFISVEEFANTCSKLSKTHIEQLKALGAFAGMADTSQVSLF